MPTRGSREQPQERNAHLLGQSSPTAGRSSEDLRLVGALRTDETRHVLYQAQDTNTRFAAEVDFFADVQQRHLLRGGDHDRSIDGRLLEKRVDRQMLI